MNSDAESQRMTCVFCKQEVAADSSSCPACGKDFPWVEQLNRMRELMKEREPNRLRATWVVVEEVFDYLKTGKPLSQSAIKGLIGAWLFPRALIVVGSVVTGLVLIAQTVILARQTAFLDVQTKAAQIEQESNLRGRLAKALPYIDAWKSLTVELERRPNLEGCAGCSDDAAFAEKLAWRVRDVAGMLGNAVTGTIVTLNDLRGVERPDQKGRWNAELDAFALSSASVCRTVRRKAVCWDGQRKAVQSAPAIS